MQSLINALGQHPRLVPLSYSKCKTLLTCPLKFKLQYLDKHEKGEALDKTSAEVGKFVHKVLEDCMVKCLSFGFEDGAVDFDLTWMAVQVAKGLTHSDYQLALTHKGTSHRIFKRLCALIRAEHMRVLPEATFCMDRRGTVGGLGNWPSRFFFGYIDLFLVTPCHRAVLLDYKTHSKSTENAELVDTQTRLYAYFMFKKFPNIRAITVGAAYIPDELIDMGEPLLRTTDFPILEAEVQDYLQQTLAASDLGDYSPCESKLCKWCDYFAWCPLQLEKAKNAVEKKEKKTRSKK